MEEHFENELSVDQPEAQEKVDTLAALKKLSKDELLTLASRLTEEKKVLEIQCNSYRQFQKEHEGQAKKQLSDCEHYWQELIKKQNQRTLLLLKYLDLAGDLAKLFKGEL